MIGVEVTKRLGYIMSISKNDKKYIKWKRQVIVGIAVKYLRQYIHGGIKKLSELMSVAASV
jgi:hypothetical protein